MVSRVTALFAIVLPLVACGPEATPEEEHLLPAWGSSGKADSTAPSTALAGKYDAIGAPTLFSQLVLSDNPPSTPRMPAEYLPRRYSGTRDGAADAGEYVIWTCGAETFMQLWSDARKFPGGSEVSPGIRVRHEECAIYMEEMFQHTPYGSYRALGCEKSWRAALPAGRIKISIDVDLVVVDSPSLTLDTLHHTLTLYGVNPGTIEIALPFGYPPATASTSITEAGEFELSGASKYRQFSMDGYLTGDGEVVITRYYESLIGSTFQTNLHHEARATLGPNIPVVPWTKTASGYYEGNTSCGICATQDLDEEIAAYRTQCDQEGGQFACRDYHSGCYLSTGFFSYVCSAFATCDCT